MGVFVWALAPFLVCFGAVLLFASFPLAKRKSGWGICGSSLFVWLWFSLFVLIDLLISRTYVLVQCFSCLLSCKDRALARHRPISRKKKVRLGCRPFGQVFEPGGTDRLDTYCTGGTRILDAFPAQAVVERRNYPCWHKNSNKLNVPTWRKP